MKNDYTATTVLPYISLLMVDRMYFLDLVVKGLSTTTITVHQYGLPEVLSMFYTESTVNDRESTQTSHIHQRCFQNSFLRQPLSTNLVPEKLVSVAFITETTTANDMTTTLALHHDS